MVDGVEIARERLSGDHPGEFFDCDYQIPVALTQDRTEITVRFEPEPNVSAGPVFGVRLLTARSDADPTSRGGAALATAPAE
jgi:hypothetical protein